MQMAAGPFFEIVALTNETTGHMFTVMKKTMTKAQIPKAQIRLKLLETGLRLFGENGYNGTGIKEIVEAVGVPKGSFYNYFKSKEDFTVDIIGFYSDTLAIQWDDLLAKGPAEPLAALRNSFERIISHHEQCEVRTGCLIGNLAAEISEASDLCRQKMHHSTMIWKNRISDHILQGQSLGTIRNDITAIVLAEFIWNAWEGALLNMKIVGSTVPVKDCIRLLFDFFLKPKPKYQDRFNDSSTLKKEKYVQII